MKAFGRVVAVGGVMAAVVALALVVTSLIARESGPSGEGLHVSTAQSEGPVASTPTPTAACVVQPEYDVELPEGCVPVDTEEMMRSNRRYKERMDPEVEAVNVAREQLPIIGEALMPLAEQRMVSPAEAREALAAAGYGDNVQIRPYVD
ncbi:hypothetical protein, partial [Phytoactinopolyspora endophytica]|uniref:hypothetical protein n=1 Tax=Phytoactinopolyspora endophytica TaxID=1642495 RepID=UPI0013EC8BB0